MGGLDFERVNSAIVNNALSYLEEWFPEGKKRGNEFVVGNIHGDPGDSLSINIPTGKWSDFATGERGGDYISLHAAKFGLTQGESYKTLAPSVDIPSNGGNGSRKKSVNSQLKLMPPPNNNEPNIDGAESIYKYRGSQGELLFLIARYREGEGKRLSPFSYDGSKWVNKSWPAPRPLYGLDRLVNNPDKRIIIVEGEKCVDAFLTLDQNLYEPITWPNGVNSIHKVDWGPIHGRKILIWPDADPPGIKAAYKIASILGPHCPEIKILDVSKQEQNGYDVADAVKQGSAWADIKAWCREIVETYELPKPAIVEPDPKPEPDGPVPIITVTEDLGPPPDEKLKEFLERCGCGFDLKGHPFPNISNILRILTSYDKFNTLIWFDEFHQKHFTNLDSEKRREWEDIDFVGLTEIFQRQFGFPKIALDTVTNAVRLFAKNNRKNEAKEWCDSLKWDGLPRIDMFFTDCMSADNSEYVISASRNFWLSIVARVYDPGCKVDNMVVLEGGQGTYKSTALRIIGGDWFAEAHESVSSKDFLILLHSKLLVEISELGAFSKADTAIVKKIVSCQVDRFRPPYGKTAHDFPRRCVFVGTTNEGQYLNDSTGNRRFWPIDIGSINIETIKKHRDQLFAEAISRYKSGEKWWNMPEKETIEAQEKRRHGDDVWIEAIKNYTSTRTYTTTKDVAINALDFNLSQVKLTHQIRIGKILSELNWETGTSWIDGETKRCWTPKQD